MFHAHIISFVTCFICILCHLFTFSWTNLLTRCPVPVSCFLLFFRFRKVTQEIFSELHGTKTHRHILPSRRRRQKERRRGAVEPPHHLVARVPPPARREVVWGPQGSLGVSPSPINTSSCENPTHPIKYPRKVLSPPSSSTLDREGSRALSGTLPEGRSSPEGSTSPCLPPV